MAQLGMMDESKEMIHNDDDGQEEGVEEEYIEDNEMMDNVMGALGYAEEHEVPYEPLEHDPYGGMDHDIYDAIVHFKRTGEYPLMADQRTDRSAHCHWRLRCSRFSMHEDQMTLMYGADDAADNREPKFVVRRGEAKDVIGRVHVLIGHVGTKRTQAALQKKMYWRSVRNDVMQFVATCDFCLRKKQDGKKLSKAPVDISSDDFDLDVQVEYSSIPGRREFRVRLHGYDEAYVAACAQSKMTSYTFRSTESEHRKMYRSPSFFKRQPYLRRSRHDDNPTFLVPVLHRDTREPTYMTFPASRLHETERMHAVKNKYMDDIEDEEELTPVDPTVASGSRATSAASERAAAADEAAAGPSTSRPRVGAAVARQRALRQAKVYDTNHPAYRRSKAERPIKGGHQRRDEHGALRGAASRLSGMMMQNSLRGDGQSSGRTAAAAAERHLLYGQTHGLVGHDFATSYDDRDRPELALLPPILLMASNDPEVAELQKELLTRQLQIQKMQLQVLQAHLENRYEEVVVDGREDVEELNVIDTDGY